MKARAALQTVIAGLIAGVVISCASDGREMLAQAMRDAGEALLDAGTSSERRSPPDKTRDGGQVDAGAFVEVLRDAGQALVDAGAALDASVDSDTPLPAMAQTEGFPHPRHILVDKDGAAIDAVVWPACDTTACTQRLWEVTRASTVADYPCVSVNYLGAQRLGLNYSLSTGRITDCIEDSGSFRAADALFLDAQCDGTPYTTLRGFVYARNIAGTAYAATGASDQSVATYYRWDATDETCDMFTVGAPIELWRYTAVPAWLTDALPDAPYTLQTVY